MPNDVIYTRSLTIVYGDVALEPYSTVDCESPDRVWTILSHVRDLADFVEPDPLPGGRSSPVPHRVVDRFRQEG